MSMRSDMLPEVYCQELTRLRTDVIPMPYETAVSIIESELQRPVSDIFSSIEQTPLGSASIAQVHPAQLKDGTKVVLKVQRPAIQKTMENDIRLLKKASGILKLTLGTKNLIDFHTILDELWETTREEIDFEKEAANLDLVLRQPKRNRLYDLPRGVSRTDDSKTSCHGLYRRNPDRSYRGTKKSWLRHD